jgi:two-component system OmpR family response regulator
MLSSSTPHSPSPASVADAFKASATGARLLVIEDDFATANEIAEEFSNSDYQVIHAADGPQGLAMAGSGKFDIVIMDRMLPGLDGLSILAALRQADIRTPVLIMSALGEVDEKVRGLKAGGDDYLTKPFAMVELAARVEALLRRPAINRDTTLTAGTLRIDLIQRTASRGEREIELLPREFKLLEYMMRHTGQVLTRAMLLENVWNCRFIAESNLVDVHIGKLRKKIDGAGEPAMIHCVRGTGFILEADA